MSPTPVANLPPNQTTQSSGNNNNPIPAHHKAIAFLSPLLFVAIIIVYNQWISEWIHGSRAERAAEAAAEMEEIGIREGWKRRRRRKMGGWSAVHNGAVVVEQMDHVDERGDVRGTSGGDGVLGWGVDGSVGWSGWEESVGMVDAVEVFEVV